jgi:hypothetical protein
MANITVSSEALEKLRDEVERGRGVYRLLCGVALLNLAAYVLTTVAWLVNRRPSIAPLMTSAAFLTMIFSLSIVVYQFKRTIVQLFPHD